MLLSRSRKALSQNIHTALTYHVSGLGVGQTILPATGSHAPCRMVVLRHRPQHHITADCHLCHPVDSSGIPRSWSHLQRIWIKELSFLDHQVDLTCVPDVLEGASPQYDEIRSIPITGRLHDAVPSTLRAGVASGVGTLTWLTFLPFAFLFGVVSDRSGASAGGWTLGAVAVLAVVLLAWTVCGFVRSPAGVPLEQAFAADQFRLDDDPQWPGHWVDPPAAWEQPGVQIMTDATVAEVREAIIDGVQRVCRAHYGVPRPHTSRRRRRLSHALNPD
jgi:hypothetical protein